MKLSFQKQDCDVSLSEGIEEYRNYLKANGRYVLGENCSPAERLTILNHDAQHVIFGLDTSLEEEAMLDCWLFFGGNYIQLIRDYFSGSLELKETKEKVNELVREVGYLKSFYYYSKVVLLKWPKIFIRTIKMKKKWNYFMSEVLLTEKISSIRDSYNIRILSNEERKIKKVNWSRAIS
tara:strand:- start:84 stop:620 length:537 start_codon:yes stop_codon:yes gene_type:complete